MGHPEWPKAVNPLMATIYEGHSGVALFMVLSGFILATGTFGQKISYAGFLKNRFLRIFPLMILVLVFALYGTPELDLGKIAAPFLLLENTSAAFQGPSGLAGTVWTSSVEFQFYLIAPFLFLLVGRRGVIRFVLPALLLFWVLRMAVLLPLRDKPEELFRISYFTIVGRVDQFLIGITLAYMVDSGKLNFGDRRRIGTVVLLAATIGIVALPWLINQQGGVRVWHMWHVVFPEAEACLWAAFLWGYLAARPFDSGRSFLLVGNTLAKIGLISFSLYILHYGFQREFWTVAYPLYFKGHLEGTASVLGISILLLMPILAISALSYSCIEEPFQKMRSRYISPPVTHAVRLKAAE